MTVRRDTPWPPVRGYRHVFTYDYLDETVRRITLVLLGTAAGVSTRLVARERDHR